MALLGQDRAAGAVGADGVDMVVDSSCLFGRSVRWGRAMSKGLMSLWGGGDDMDDGADVPLFLVGDSRPRG